MIKFKIIISSDVKIDNISTNLNEKLKNYEITEVKKYVEKNNINYNFKLQFFQTGKIKIPSIEFNILTKDGKYKINSEPITINVLSNLNDNTSFRDIKPPELVGFYLTTKEFVILLIIIFFITLLAILIKTFLNRNKNRAIEVRKLAPFEEFNENLKICNKFLKENNLKSFYFKLSESVRIYIDRTYNCNTLEATLNEIETFFNTNKIALKENIKTDILNLLKKWDFYKFTGIFPEKEKAKKELENIKDIIELIEKENVSI